MASAFPAWELEAENERSQQQPFRAGSWWVLGGSVQPRTQCSLLGVEITAWLAELPLLPKVPKFQNGFFVWLKTFICSLFKSV